MVEGNLSMQGKVCMVTGATRGIGYAVAKGLAQKGANVVIVGRSEERIRTALTGIRQAVNGACVEGLLADLSSQADVRKLARDFSARYSTLDVLVNNVGATILKYQQSPDGLEMTWALNYLNHFLLTHLLLNSLRAAANANGEARIVEVTSSVYRFSDPQFKRLQQQKGYNGVLAYAQSKRAIQVYTHELARRMQGTGVTINAITPGFVATNIAGGNGFLATIMMALIKRVSKPVDEGVRPIVHLASAPELCGKSGGYYKSFTAMPDDPLCKDQDIAARLWKMSEEMTGLESIR